MWGGDVGGGGGCCRERSKKSGNSLHYVMMDVCSWESHPVNPEISGEVGAVSGT